MTKLCCTTGGAIILKGRTSFEIAIIQMYQKEFVDFEKGSLNGSNFQKVGCKIC